MAIHNSLESLNRFIEKATIASLQEETANLVLDTIRQYLYTNFYSYSPKVYERTYEFMNSLVKSKVTKIANGYEIEVYFDTDKIHPNYTTGQHAGNGVDISDDIPWMAEDGMIQPYRQNHRGGFIEDTMAELTGSKGHVKAMADALRNKGIKVIF